MSKPSQPIRDALSKFAQWLIPTTSRKAFYNWRASEPSFETSYLDVDRLRNLLLSAETGNVRDLFGVYRDVLIVDSHIQAEFNKRKLALLGDTLSIQPFQKGNNDDLKAADFIKSQFLDFDGRLTACNHLLDSILWPLSLVEKVYKPSSTKGVRYDLAALNTVQANDLDFTTGWLRLRRLDQHGGYLTGDLEDPDPNRYIIHRGHLLNHADFWGGPFRCILYWWLLRTMSRDWWARFLERYGSPFIVGKYDQSDDESRAILSNAFSAASKIFGLVISRETEVELIESAAAQTGEAFRLFMHEACNDEISRFIVGQTASSNMHSTGLGSGVSKQHENVRQDIRQFDSMLLGNTLRQQLFRPLLLINGFAGRPPKAIWGGLSPDDQESMGQLLANLAQANLEPTDEGVDALSEQFGIPLQRKAPPVPAFDPGGGPGFQEPGGLPLAARALPPQVAASLRAIDQIAATAAPDLARAFRDELAEIPRIVRDSTSPADCERRLAHFFATYRPGRSAQVLEPSILSAAANGAVSRSGQSLQPLSCAAA
jgi:phage gp29-like protein